MRKLNTKLLGSSGFLVLSACQPLFLCGEEHVVTYPSPSGEYSVAGVARSCGATTGVLKMFYLVKSEGLFAVPNADHKFKEHLNFMNVEDGYVGVEWQSNDKIIINYDEEADFFKKETGVGKTKIAYQLLPDRSWHKKRVQYQCPAIIEKLSSEIPGLKNGRYFSRTGEMNRLQTDNYKQFVSRAGNGIDFYCTVLPGREEGKGWRVIVRVDENFTSTIPNQVRPLYVEELGEPNTIIWSVE